MGYSTDIFASEPSEGFICAICHDVLKDACSLNCGHTFCGGCIDSCRASSNNPSCPNCRVEMTSSNPNYAMKDVIGELALKQCPDCNWTGQLKELESHENTCAFRVVTCDVDGCNHTCKRKDMGEHTSNTAVMIRHLELKHDRKLKDMKEDYDLKLKEVGEDYERKLVQQKSLMQNKLQTHERRIHALESRKRSVEDISNNDSDGPDEMVVEGCGTSAVNGVYKRNGTYNDAPMYVRSARYGGQDAVFTLYRYGSRNRCWCISIIAGDEPTFYGDTDFYHVESEDPLPPRTGWISDDDEYDPPPTVRAS